MPRTLADWLDYIEKLHAKPIDLGLERMRTMIDRLGIGFSCPVITVAGTNGKGSTCAFIESVCRAAGLKTAMHTSPHLLRFNERALIDGREVEDHLLTEAFAEVEAARGATTLSYFEFTGLGILKVFQRAQPDVVILEIGLGGRLDAMNAIDPDCSVVAAIGLDHTALLGSTREAIGLEKAHIFRSGRPAVCSDPEPPVTLVDHAHRIGAELRLINRDFRVRTHEDGAFDFAFEELHWTLPRPGLAGANQYRNAAGALAALAALRERLPVTEAAAAEGVARARITARFECVSTDPCPILIDVGHNPQAAAVLAENLALFARPGERTLAVFGMLTDKDRESVVRLTAPAVDHWFYAGLPGPRGGSAEELAQHMRAAGVSDESMSECASIAVALAAARREALRLMHDEGSPARIIVFGSFVTVGEALEALAAEGVRR